MSYDYLIVGSGLFGSIFAHEAKLRGKTCLVIEKRDHLGGNIFCKQIEGINVHYYGAHIFHTNNDQIWNYITKFSEFNNFVNSPLAIYKDEIYNLPFNMNTFSKMFKIITPDQAKKIINSQVEKLNIKNPKNLEEQALSLVGPEIYEKLIKGYTEKQWGRDCRDLPKFIINRIPLRFTYNNNYFNAKHQGIPIGGYNPIIEKMLSGVETKLNTDYFEFKKTNPAIAKKIVYTGMIDKYFSYQYGYLEYRTLRFDHKILDIENFQGNAVINYTEKEIPYTRIIEHKHFEFGTQTKSVISYEFPAEWSSSAEPFYPINDQKNSLVYDMYSKLKDQEDNVIFGGRLGDYKYYDMDAIIANALRAVSKEFD